MIYVNSMKLCNHVFILLMLSFCTCEWDASWLFKAKFSSIWSSVLPATWSSDDYYSTDSNLCMLFFVVYRLGRILTTSSALKLF